MKFLDIINSINLTSKVFFIFFIVFSILQIILCFAEKNLLRKIFKPFCIMFLAIAVTMAVPNHRFLYAATYLAIVGDVFLIRKKGRILFPLGTSFFLCGHVMYYVECNLVLRALGASYVLPVWVHFAYWGLVTLLAFVFVKPVKKITQGRFLFSLGASFYYVTIIMSSLTYVYTTVMCFGAGIQNYMWLAIIGIVFFIISDLLVGYTRFKNDIKRRDFFIMLTYLVAECLIVLAFVLTYYANPTMFLG